MTEGMGDRIFGRFVMGRRAEQKLGCSLKGRATKATDERWWGGRWLRGRSYWTQTEMPGWLEDAAAVTTMGRLPLGR